MSAPFQLQHAKPLRIPCVLMRGGTSRGPFFLAADLPAEPAARAGVLLAVMGSPHMLQLDGLGGGNSLTSKVAIVSRSARADADVDYLFAQVAVDRALVDLGPNCGNMLAAVGPFAIEAGLVPAREGETPVRVYNSNTGALVEALVSTPGGIVEYDGTTAIDGVAGTAAAVKLNFLRAVGSKTGALLPSGKVRETIDGVPVTLVDYATPMLLLRAVDFGLAGDETPAELDADDYLLARLETIRREAGRRMGLGDVAGHVLPKIGLLSPARDSGSLTSRYLTPDRCHRSHAVTGALCIAAASRLAGSVAQDVLSPHAGSLVTIEHPSGTIQVDLALDEAGEVVRASLIRTARRIFEGNVIVPANAMFALAERAETGGNRSHDHDAPSILYLNGEPRGRHLPV
ncbi:MAG TPA: 4-oxalomesaconate tautomerase [Bosea sp. (in: a-proteobacteria)]|uniref:4-oxalomesaconate tautomerase n=1 Tax=Bosea sp. (in: a-proteobacteria) TaxID=1871050 RepID=UPI002E0FB41D|nr:4-oxalomesaconate tautomerase [Bosea sp. (in: a-proteobacteria)]